MRTEVKRYAFRLSQLSEVMGGRLEVVEYSGDGLPYVLATDYDALHAEAEALRVVLLGIASVNPAERGIEWAKAFASDGLNGSGSELYARWLDAFNEAESLREQRDNMAQILRDLVPGCKWRIMSPRIDQALQEVDGGN